MYVIVKTKVANYMDITDQIYQKGHIYVQFQSLFTITCTRLTVHVCIPMLKVNSMILLKPLSEACPVLLHESLMILAN